MKVTVELHPDEHFELCKIADENGWNINYIYSKYVTIHEQTKKIVAEKTKQLTNFSEAKMIIQGKYRNYIVHDENNIKGFFGEYRWLSNFHICTVRFEGVEYPSSENAYMAAKTTDLELRKQFETITPPEARKLGKKIELREGWNEMRIEVMSSIIFDKFLRNKDLREALLKTGDKYLEESCHWHDYWWAVHYNEDGVGKGENNLGKILMRNRNYWK